MLRDNDIEQQYRQDLVDRYLRGEMTSEEQAQFGDALQVDPQLRETYALTSMICQAIAKREATRRDLISRFKEMEQAEAERENAVAYDMEDSCCMDFCCSEDSEDSDISEHAHYKLSASFSTSPEPEPTKVSPPYGDLDEKAAPKPGKKPLMKRMIVICSSVACLAICVLLITFFLKQNDAPQRAVAGLEHGARTSKVISGQKPQDDVDSSGAEMSELDLVEKMISERLKVICRQNSEIEPGGALTVAQLTDSKVYELEWTRISLLVENDDTERAVAALENYCKVPGEHHGEALRLREKLKRDKQE